jgi:hypothetical protein
MTALQHFGRGRRSGRRSGFGRRRGFADSGAFYAKELQEPKRWSCLVVGWLIAGFFAAVVCAYGCTEYLLVRLDVRRGIADRGMRPLPVILAANLMSFVLLWVSSLAFVLASGADLYLHATILCVCAQMLWLGQHLWAYYRDRPRVRYEQ